MTAKMLEQIVLLIAGELSQTSGVRALIETQLQTLLGREIVELRIFLHRLPSLMTADKWLWLYRRDLLAALEVAGLELAVDEWFTPTQQIPSCSCWIDSPPAIASQRPVRKSKR